MRASDIDTIRRGERAACVDLLRAMARKAERQPDGITMEGGIDPQHVARILEAAAREVERVTTIDHAAPGRVPGAALQVASAEGAEA
jgi:hypothetical protein